ncbi:hypothetical protein AX15_005368 [Amanita polypyramis BW_CC]|nr:hypothetical protein AX15_005368 [Amanita polypyramis BW_CC]
MRKTSWAFTFVAVVITLIAGVLSLTRPDWLVAKNPEVLHAKVTVYYGLMRRCELDEVNIPGPSNGKLSYTSYKCRKFPAPVSDGCDKEHRKFCAVWTTAGYASELSIGFGALSILAIFFGVSTHSRRRRIWRAVASLVSLQAIFQIMAFAIVTDAYNELLYPTFDYARPGLAYVLSILTWVVGVLTVLGVVTTGISAEKGHRSVVVTRQTPVALSGRTPSKPSLQGVRIKARKGAVKAHAKHEPIVFKDQLYKHLETVGEGDFDAFASKLAQAGSTLEFLKYADILFEIILAGGLLQPGGGYLEDGPNSPFTIFNANYPVQIEEMKKYVDVLAKLIRRYKYLQKPLEESSLPTLLQYINRWPAEQSEKFAMAVGLLLSQGLANGSCLQSLTKDHLVKNDLSISVLTLIFRAYLHDQSMEHLSATLKRGGIKDLLAFFPLNKRAGKVLEEHFKKENLSQVAEWWAKKQYAVVRDGLIKELKGLCEREESPEIIITTIKTRQEETPVPETELVHCIWHGLMSSVDWGARPDQIEGLALREVGKYSPILEPFCSSPKTQIALINVVQLYCYEDTRIIKAFPQILKVLYNKDCISDKAIIYWHQKGSKPQGRQHFLKSTEALVKFLQEQEDSEGSGEE